MVSEEICAGLGSWATLPSIVRSVFRGIWQYSVEGLQIFSLLLHSSFFFVSLTKLLPLIDVFLMITLTIRSIL